MSGNKKTHLFLGGFFYFAYICIMKKILLLLILFTSFNLLSQKYNLDYNHNMNILDRTWLIDTKIIENTVIFNWEKDIVTYILIKSNDLVFPKVDAFMTSQLTLNSLNIGKYEVIFLDDCNAILCTKEFEIK
jgi:hypothetical protein